MFCTLKCVAKDLQTVYCIIKMRFPEFASLNGLSGNKQVPFGYLYVNLNSPIDSAKTNAMQMWSESRNNKGSHTNHWHQYVIFHNPIVSTVAPCIEYLNVTHRHIEPSPQLYSFSSGDSKVRCLPSSITFSCQDRGFLSEDQLQLMFPSRLRGPLNTWFKESRHQENIKSFRWKTIHK